MECYEISMKSSARKSWKQLVARIKELHSSYAVIRMLSAWGCLVHQMAGILIPLTMEPVLLETTSDVMISSHVQTWPQHGQTPQIRDFERVLTFIFIILSMSHIS